MKSLPNAPVVVPWLRRDQWSRFREVFAGDDRLPSSYDEWLEQNRAAAIGTGLDGVGVRRVEIDVDGLVAWCTSRNRVVDPLSMMLFASAVAWRQDHPAAGRAPGRPAPLPSFVSRTMKLGPFGPKVTFYTVADPPGDEPPPDEAPESVH